MRCYHVSTRINDVANDDEACARPSERAEVQDRSFHSPVATGNCGIGGCRASNMIERASHEVIARRGNTVDVLVNNAGHDTRHRIADVTPAYWDQAIAVNLKHHFFQVVYVTAKAAIVGLTRTLSHELGVDNIRVNCMMPGAILTERPQRLWVTEAYTAEILANQVLKRMILPEEVARLVLLLASDDSSAITNQSYVTDAGWV